MNTGHRITLAPGGLAFSCGAEENLLQALQRVGVAPDLLAAIPVGCRGGGCGVCRIHVRAGQFHTGRMSRKHISEADEEALKRLFTLKAAWLGLGLGLAN